VRLTFIIDFDKLIRRLATKKVTWGFEYAMLPLSKVNLQRFDS